MVRCNSTLRFWARPDAVVLDAIGTTDPNPLDVTCVRAAARSRRLSCRRAGALIGLVGNAVLVLIRRHRDAAGVVDLLASRRVRTAVGRIQDPIPVSILLRAGATLGVHHLTHPSPGASIRFVVHVVAVGVPLAGGAAGGVNRFPRRRAGTLIEFVADAILILILRLRPTWRRIQHQAQAGLRPPS